MEFGFRIPIFNGIPDSLSFIPDSKAQDSWLHKQKFLRFRIPQAKISWTPESGVPYTWGEYFSQMLGARMPLMSVIASCL